MSEIISEQLSSVSTLGELPYFACHISPDTPSESVAQQFEEHPELPGVIVVEGDSLVGMVSKVKFFERMSKQFGRELYLPRPIKLLPEIEKPKVPPLLLSGRTPIEEGVRQALSRPANFVYEPIVVRKARQLCLVDMRVALLAQTQILTKRTIFIEQQHVHTQQLLQSLQAEQERNKIYAQRLEEELNRIQQMNERLETQERESRQQAERIASLNERFVSISHLLSQRGQTTFEQTFAGVSQIGKYTAAVYKVSERLNSDLATVDLATHQIGEITRQVRHLAVQASLIANRHGETMAGFDFISDAINKLANQVALANHQVAEIASQFRMNIREVVQLTSSGEDIARSLFSQIEETQKAIQELEALATTGEEFLPDSDDSYELSVA